MFKKTAAALISLLIAFSAIPHFSALAGTSPVRIVRFSENFDAVTAPALPSGWSAASTGAGTAFVSSANLPQTAPNSVFSPSQGATGSASLTSPEVLVSGASTFLNFRHQYAMETTWDGGVLEVSVGGGPFQDIIDAGGSFVAGGYTHDLNPSTNPVGGRRAWSGATPGQYVLTSVKLPSNAFGQYVRFRWTLGTNDSFGADGWRIDSISLETEPTAANLNAITISASGNANPYPSEIQVSLLPGFVTGVSVSIEDLSHTSPNDVDILLVAPNGRKVILMSDAGGSNAIVQTDLTFTDAAASELPDQSAIAAGIYRPTNYGDADVFPPPAPQTPGFGTTLASLFGTNPNGAWQLFVVDDTGANSGAIAGGWSLDIKTSVNACLFTVSPTVQSFPAAGGTGGFAIDIPAGCGWSASTSSGFVTITSPVSGEGPGGIAFSVASNVLGARTGLINVTDGINSRTFQVQQGSGCPTSISQSTLNIGAGGGPATIDVAAGAGCSWQAVGGAAWITINSPQQTGNGSAQFTIAANPSRSARSASVTIGAQTVTVNQAGAPAARFDFDGDGRTDISVFRDGLWFLLQSTSGFGVQPFGIATDRLVPADYDGDGKTDVSVFRDGVWYVLRSSDSQVSITQFGLAGDLPVPADFDGDGRADRGIYRNGTWYVLDSATNQVSVAQFGIAGDKPVAGDYDGDGKSDLAVFRNGTWYLLRSSLGFVAVRFGLDADIPVQGDFDGDGRTDPAVFRNGNWHVLANLQNYTVTQFGLAGDVPVAGDYDGDGRADAAIFRAGIWYLLRSQSGIAITQFGLPTDIPVPATSVP